MPGRSGLEILADVKKACPRLPVLMLSAATEQQYGLRVLKAGASGYITKLRAPEEIVAAVKQVITGGLYVSPAMGLKLASHVSGNPTRDLHDKLSDREMEILLRIGAGAGTKEIAADLSLSPTTVSTYRARMRDKLGVKTTAELIRYTIDNNLSEP
ncbi:MAG: response regulator receiver, LuxR family [Verrucomicrobiales bacterium]|nr:response regulator receiver, LuxR family [Verrucomicrobiales bacterium]